MKNSLLATPFLFIFVLSMLLCFSGCEEEPDPDEFDTEVLDEHLKSLPPISSEMPVEKDAEVVSTETDTTIEYIYKTDYYEAAAGYNEQIVLNPATDVIYPGALVKGESILDGTYTLIPAVRKPITISTSLTGSNSVSVTVDDPKLSTVREAINELMSQEYDVPPANMGFTVEQAYSKEQIDLSLHASYKTGIIDVEGGFDFSNKKIQTRLVAKFIQSYYTLDMDMPHHPSDLFEEDVEQTLFGNYMPMYVSTVTFGRMALFTIESELEETEVSAYLNASYAAVDASASADFEALREKSTMKVYVLGGSGNAAGASIEGFDDFKNYIKTGGNYSKDSPGAPISYKLRYIRDNTIGKIVFAASYPIVTAIPRDDNKIYDIEAFLHSLTSDAGDAGDNPYIELRGDLISWPASLGKEQGHDHFTEDYQVPQKGDYSFNENTNTVKNWPGLKQNDTLKIYIDMEELDDGANDFFHEQTFEFPVSKIILEAEGTEYITQALEVIDKRTTVNDNVKFFMRFNYTMRRTE